MRDSYSDAGLEGGGRELTTSAARRSSASALAARSLAAKAELSREEILLVNTVARRRSFAAGEDMVSDAGPIGRASLLVHGWACRLRTLRDGRRQIFDFLIPGDFIGLRPDPGPLDLCTTVALTSAALVDASRLAEAASCGPERWPGLALALQRSICAERDRLLEQAIRLGRHAALERIAHLLLELQGRLFAVGLASRSGFPFPVTQETLADAVGVSVVHVNRTLGQMRRLRLVEVRAGRAKLLNPSALRSLAG